MAGHSGTREGGVAPLDVTVTPWPARLQSHKHRQDGPGCSTVNPLGRPSTKKESGVPGRISENLIYFEKHDASDTLPDFSLGVARSKLV